MYLQIPLFRTSYTTDRCVRKDVCRGNEFNDMQATKAGNQRSQGSYPGFRPRQSPARPKPWYNAGDLRAFLCLPGVAGPLKATKAGNQRSRNSYPGFRPQQTPARPKPRPILRASLRLPGAAGPRQATKAGNQRSQGSYPGVRPRQSPARPKPWYNAKSRVDRRSTREFAFAGRGGPAASNQGRKPA